MPILPFNWTKALQEVSQIKVRSITDPIFIFSIILFVIGGASATSVFNIPQWVTICLFCAGGSLLLLGIIFFIFFAIKEPNYLRSETFQLQMKSIEQMGDKNNLLPASAIIQLNDTPDTTDSSAKEPDDKKEEHD